MTQPSPGAPRSPAASPDDPAPSGAPAFEPPASGAPQVQSAATHPPLSRGTLGRQLVLRVTGLVALVAVLLSCATALATRTLLLGQVDRQLDSAMGRFGRGPGSGNGGPGGGLLLSGQQIGTLFVAVSDSGTVLGSGLLGERGQRPPLSDDAAGALQSIPDDNSPHTVTVPGVGRYRVETSDVGIRTTDPGNWPRVCGSGCHGISRRYAHFR